MKKSLIVPILFLCFTPFSSIFGQEGSPFENPQNLQVLPKDISPDQLRGIMRNFAFALGVRCTHCHDSKQDEDGFSMVFETETKETKRIAREMLKMTGGINRDIAALNRGADHKYTRVMCTTCHRGQENPFLIQTVLDNEIEKADASTALNKYSELKDKYYGGHTYDFSGFTLSEYANSLINKGKIDDALEIALYSQTANPNTAYAHTIVGNIYMEKKQYPEAIEAFESSLTLDPDQNGVKHRVEQAKAALAE